MLDRSAAQTFFGKLEDCAVIYTLARRTPTISPHFPWDCVTDYAALEGFQEINDALMASNTLKRAFHYDVSPILAEARRRAGGAIDPVACYRAAGYRASISSHRPQVAGTRSGIV